MALYVRYLTIQGQPVEVTVSRVADGYAATLRVLVGEQGPSAAKTFHVQAATADAADRAVQGAAREYLEIEGGAGNGI